MKKILITQKVRDRIKHQIYQIGDVVEVTEKRAKAFIDGGYAVEQPTEKA